MEPILVGMGEYRVVNDSTKLTCVGLGSCVALVLQDTRKQIGGMAHIMLPSRDEARNKGNLGRFADSAVPLMVKEMERRGAAKAHLKARIFGGANMFPMVPNKGLIAVGDRNVRAVKETLKKHGIILIEKETGGCRGRTVIFNPQSGTVTIKYAGEDYGETNPHRG